MYMDRMVCGGASQGPFGYMIIRERQTVASAFIAGYAIWYIHCFAVGLSVRRRIVVEVIFQVPGRSVSVGCMFMFRRVISCLRSV